MTTILKECVCGLGYCSCKSKCESPPLAQKNNYEMPEGINAPTPQHDKEKKDDPINPSKFEQIAEEIGELVTEKNKSYGNSFGDSELFLKILYL